MEGVRVEDDVKRSDTCYFRVFVSMEFTGINVLDLGSLEVSHINGLEFCGHCGRILHRY